MIKCIQYNGIEEMSEVNRSEFEMESVRLARKVFLVDWSGSEFSSEDILEDNILEISSSVSITINYVTTRGFAVTTNLTN